MLWDKDLGFEPWGQVLSRVNSRQAEKGRAQQKEVGGAGLERDSTVTLTVPRRLWRCFQHHISLVGEDGVSWVTQPLGVGLILVGEDGVS